MAPRPPIVVVGAGVAGLATALAANPSPVLLICRAVDAGGSASALAQGGIAAALDPADSVRAHERDTLLAGAGYNHKRMVRWLCAQAPAAITWLQRQGVQFDHADGRLRLGHEGGHGCARIVHAGGDASGAAVMQALLARARAAPHVQWQIGDVDALLLRGDVVCGVRVRDDEGVGREFEAHSVVLATGGIGALYARTSNPPGADGAGLALGLAAGAQARDLEFVQFHPTALDVPATHCLPLVTEALRGAGARLRDDHGRLLMAGVHALGDLAPRDVVARRVWRSQRNGERVWLDAETIGDAWATRFPTVLSACLAHGIDPRRSPIPVTPAAHFHMGGVAVDSHGATGVPGLHAVGEVACNGLHGANRLASNSLLEGVLCGRRLGSLLARQEAPEHARGTLRAIERGATLAASDLAWLRTQLWQCMGPERDGAVLQALAQQFDPAASWQARLARELVLAALRRRSSLGAHWRVDDPTLEQHQAA